MKQLFRKKFSWIFTLAVAALMVMPFAAFADTLQGDDLTAGGNATKTPNQTGTATFNLVATGPDGCNADSLNPATVTVSSNQSWLTIDAPGSVSLTGCGSGNSGTIGYKVLASAPIGGVATVSGVASGGKPGNNGYNNNPGDFTVTVTAPPDSTPPVITPNVSGTLGNNGWYTSDVTVSWSVVDSQSAISSSSGCGSTTINSDTAGMTLTCSATSAGGTSSESVTIKRDATAPTLSGAPTSNPNGAGWYKNDVTIDWTASDVLSGIDTQPTNSTINSEGTGLTASTSVSDQAGNSTEATSSPAVNIDKTAPSVSVTGVANGATYTLGSVPAAGCSTSDALSGVAANASASLSGGPVGSATATCSGAEDNAGNTAAPVSVTYSVIYNWAGFFQPIDNNGVFNVAKAGSAIPVKFSLSGNQGLLIFASGYPKATAISCPNNPSVDAIEEITTTTSGLKYDANADQYNYTWKTSSGFANTCQQLTVKLVDGTSHTANFKFTK